MDITKHCLYCHRTKEKVGELKPIYDWHNDSLVGYYCKEHYGGVKSFQAKQKSAYEDYMRRQQK